MPTIAYLGPEHTNTHMAALKRFGPRAKYIHAPTIENVFHLVEQEEAAYGVVPVENSLEGAVTYTLDQFIDFRRSPVTIYGELEQPIKHFLLKVPRIKLSEILRVSSHPQALAQCRRWLARHLPRAQLQETNSTSDAIALIVEERRNLVAGIGRAELAKAHGLKAVPIPETRDNKTRFLILSRRTAEKGRRNKTSILFALKDRPGALYDALTPFKHERINLTKIESRPSKRKAWEYYFFIDLEGHQTEPRVQRALTNLARHAEFLKVLGSYPITNR